MTGESSHFDLRGRIAVVTGGNGGIGRAIALGLARSGAAVAVLARHEEKNHLVFAELKSIGRPALLSRLDVTDRAALAPAVEQVERTLGGIDILVNNAGIVALTGGVLNETADIWDNTIETHLNACSPLSQLVAKSMVNRKSGGKIINLASMYSISGSGLVPSYSAASAQSCNSPSLWPWDKPTLLCTAHPQEIDGLHGVIRISPRSLWPTKMHVSFGRCWRMAAITGPDTVLQTL